MFDTILGLPVHPLVVHATVVVVPAAALAVGLAALWPRFRRWAGPAPLALSAVALILVPVTVQSGKALAERAENTALVQTHRQLGEDLLGWVVLLVVAAAALSWSQWRRPRTGGTHRTNAARVFAAAVVAVALLGTAGTLVQIARIAHSGAEAAWSDLTGATGRG